MPQYLWLFPEHTDYVYPFTKLDNVICQKRVELMTIVPGVICELKFCRLFGMGVKLGHYRQAKVVRESSVASGTKCRNRHNEKLYDLYSSPNIIRGVK
jgi:hypothetical protein